MGLFIGLILGFVVGSSLVGMYYADRIRDLDNLIEALRKECGAPDPDKQ